jgi:hypothetical protein
MIINIGLSATTTTKKKDEKVVHHSIDLADMKSHSSLFNGIDVVYCTLGSR